MFTYMGGGEEMRRPRKSYYWDQGGWDEFTWGGVVRIHFVFGDSLQVGGYLGADYAEGQIGEYNTVAQLAGILLTNCFAGIACAAN